MNKKIDEKLYLTFTPNEDIILGVFEDMIHVKNEENILIIPRNEYFRIWNIWLDSKKKYCEDRGYYCGVFGGAYPLEYTKSKPITLNEWSRSAEDMRKVKYNVPSLCVSGGLKKTDFQINN